MEFEKSSLYLEVQSIFKSGINLEHYYYEAVIHLPDQNLIPIKVISIDLDKDYEVNYTDEIVLRILMPMGQYAKRLFKNKNNFEVTIKRTPLKEIAEESNSEKNIFTERFIGILVNQSNPLLEQDSGSIINEEVLDISDLLEVDIQLLSKPIDLIRMKTFGAPFRKATVTEVIQTVVMKESNNLNLDAISAPQGIDFVTANNTEVKEHILVPQGTKIIDLPNFLQKHYGIYTSDVGFYYQDKYWFVYPIYNHSRFEEVDRKFTIINVPSTKLLGVEKTYRKDGNNIVALATGNNTIKDESDYDQLNHGNGARFLDASKVLDGFIDVKDNKATAVRTRNMNEVMNVPRDSNRNNVQFSPERITSNVFKSHSDLAKRNGSLITFNWENADPTLIYPGMPIKIMQLQGDKIEVLYGVLLKAHTYIHVKGRAVFANRHFTNIALCVFVNKVSNLL